MDLPSPDSPVRELRETSATLLPSVKKKSYRVTLNKRTPNDLSFVYIYSSPSLSVERSSSRSARLRYDKSVESLDAVLKTIAIRFIDISVH